MLKPETVAAMSPSQLAEALQAEAVRWYGNDRYRPSLARDFRIGLSTVHTWKPTPQHIPHAVILCLSAWNELHRVKTEAAAAVQDYAGQLKQLADRIQS
jgi:hypothetical protein